MPVGGLAQRANRHWTDILYRDLNRCAEGRLIKEGSASGKDHDDQLDLHISHNLYHHSHRIAGKYLLLTERLRYSKRFSSILGDAKRI
jgi:hypothetical protein